MNIRNIKSRVAWAWTLCVFCTGPALRAGDESIKAPLPGYQLVWHDEFNGNALDTSQWNYRTDERYWSRQLPANVAVHDGFLWLELKKQKVGDKEYTAGGVISKREFKYGYYEARFKIPPGKGWHTSFWTMKHGGGGDTSPEDSLQELDICENDSIHPLKYAVNTHRWHPDPHIMIGSKGVPTPDLSKDFHVWGCEFTPLKITYYFEGKVVQEVDATKLIQHNTQNIWLTSIAASIGKTDAVDDSVLPAAAVFDYVRFFARP